ncbi:MAG: TIGR02757 family protein [Chlorobi bacterium]|nr:TIGR02757 family protein [Chlorobiota bacterium]
MDYLSDNELKSFLEEKFYQFNTLEYINTDPIQIPHSFTKKEDIEISAFLASTIAWGQRKTIIKNARQLMHLMENNPYEFIINAGKREFSKFNNFKHRTFNEIDCVHYLKAIQHIYLHYNGFESFFKDVSLKNNLTESINNLRQVFFEIPHEKRTKKHFPNIDNGSAAKRLNMFLRWMVRTDKTGVDFGLWNKSISMSQLYIPLDVHVGNVARKLGLLKRKQNDWKAVLELTGRLKQFDKNDPVKYDYALFGLGVFEKF